MHAPEKFGGWNYLAASYSEKSDEELLEFSKDFDGFTEIAQQVLRNELQKRKLWLDNSVRPLDETRPLADPEEISSLQDIVLGGTSICECETTKRAELVCYALEGEKISCVIYRPQSRFYEHLPQVRVAPDDADRASAFLAKGVPDRTIREFEALPKPEDFINPQRPKCRSDDILLESVDPANEWLCEACGNRWQETIAAQEF